MRTSLVTLSAFLEVIYVSASPLSVDVEARSSLICGQAGYDAGTESFWGSTVDTYSTCSSACTQQKCKSFAYGSGDCQLYDVSAQSNFVADQGSPYLFYDSGCVTGTTITISTTSAKKTSSSTKKTTTAATTTPGTRTLTTTTSAAVSPTGLICGQPDYIANTDDLDYWITDYQEPTIEALSDCYQKCVSYDRLYCARWLWSPGKCDLFGWAKGADDFQWDPNSSNLIWYLSCGSPDPNSPTTTAISPTVTPAVPVCGQKCFFPDDHSDLHYFLTDYGDPIPSQGAFDDCYQRCIAYEDGYCEGYLVRQGECELWREPPTPWDGNWHPMMSDWCWARDCGPPVLGGGAGSASTASTTTKTATISIKLGSSTSTAKGTSSSTTIKAITTTASPKASTSSSSNISTTKVVTTSTSTKPSASSSSIASTTKAPNTITTTRASILPSTTTKSSATTSSSSTKTSAQTTSKSTTTVTPSSTTRAPSQDTSKATTTTAATITTNQLTTTTTISTASTSNILICGQQGYFSGSSGFEGFQTDYDEPTQQALTQCYQYCVNSNQGYCAGWYWSPNICVLFSYAPAGYHFQASSDSGDYVWNRNCGAPVATYSAFTTKVTTATTTKITAKT